MDTLEAQGQTAQGLLTNIFKGCVACYDKHFVDYI